MTSTSSAGLAPDVLHEVERLERADLVAFLGPLWRLGLPAIPKGWVDRAFVYGRVYGNGLTFETGPLKGKGAMLALATGGPQSSYSGGRVHGGKVASASGPAASSRAAS
jgi:NAD(P)H dehydrogenase (quinone)